MRLHVHALSGNSYKVRLLLGALALPCEEVAVDIPAGAHRSASFLHLNPLGQVPVLEDGEITLRDSQAILAYLARRYDPSGAWLPEDAAGLGRVQQWLSFAANEIHHGANLARLHFLLGVPVDLAVAQQRARDALALLDRHLEGRNWLELGRPTVADLACFPYAALAPEGQVPLDPYPYLRAWIERVKTLPGYVAMPGL